MAQQFSRLTDQALNELAEKGKLWRSSQIPALTEAELPVSEVQHGRLDKYHGHEYWQNVLTHHSAYLPQDIPAETLLEHLNKSSPFILNYPQRHTWRKERPRVEDLNRLAAWRRSINENLTTWQLNMQAGAEAPPALPTRLDLWVMFILGARLPAQSGEKRGQNLHFCLQSQPATYIPGAALQFLIPEIGLPFTNAWDATYWQGHPGTFSQDQQTVDDPQLVASSSSVFPPLPIRAKETASFEVEEEEQVTPSFSSQHPFTHPPLPLRLASSPAQPIHEQYQQQQEQYEPFYIEEDAPPLPDMEPEYEYEQEPAAPTTTTTTTTNDPNALDEEDIALYYMLQEEIRQLDAQAEAENANQPPAQEEEEQQQVVWRWY